MRSPFTRSLALASIVFAHSVAAQAVITPSAPTSHDVITARSEYITLACNTTVRTNVSGSTIRTDIEETGCVIGPPPFPNVIVATFGPLPAGTYTHEVYLQLESDPPTFLSRQTIVVSAAVPPVPTAETWALLLLGGGIALVGVVVCGVRAE